jgi:hypothetical protein
MSVKEEVNLDKLIVIEWDLLQDLKNMLSNPELSIGEKTRMANAIAYHASVLNKLLNQKGENSQFNEATLGDYIRGIDRSSRRLIRRDFRGWTKKLSLKK